MIGTDRKLLSGRSAVYLHRVEVRADDALGRRGFLHLSDERDVAAPWLAEGTEEVAEATLLQRRTQLSGCHRLVRELGDFEPLLGDDSF